MKIRHPTTIRQSRSFLSDPHDILPVVAKSKCRCSRYNVRDIKMQGRNKKTFRFANKISAAMRLVFFKRKKFAHHFWQWQNPVFLLVHDVKGRCLKMAWLLFIIVRTVVVGSRYFFRWAVKYCLCTCVRYVFPRLSYLPNLAKEPETKWSQTINSTGLNVWETVSCFSKLWHKN